MSANPRELRCEQAEELLSARLDRRLSPGESAALQAHLAGCRECRAAAGEYAALASGLEAAFRAEPLRASRPAPRARRISPARGGPRRAREARRNPASAWIWIAAAAAAVVVAAVALRGGGAGAEISSGAVYAGGQAVKSLEPGRSYSAGPEGARLAAAGGGALEFSGGAAFRLTPRGISVDAGEMVGRNVVRAELQAGPFLLEPAGATLAVERADSGRESAVVAVAGQPAVRWDAGSARLAPGQVLTQGWGLPTAATTVEDAEAKLKLRRETLAPAGAAGRYRGILSEYEARLTEFRRDLEAPGRSPAESAELRSRIASLSDCKAAHERRVPQLSADETERSAIGRRLGFLERAKGLGIENPPPTAARERLRPALAWLDGTTGREPLALGGAFFGKR